MSSPANLTQAAPAPCPASGAAKVLQLPGALTEPLRQRRRGRLPKAVASIWRARLSRSSALQLMALQAELAEVNRLCDESYRVVCELDELRESTKKRIDEKCAVYKVLDARRNDLKASIAALAVAQGGAA